MSTVTTPTRPANPESGLLSAPLRMTTVGVLALVFSAALTSLAITTIMPAVSAELDGQAMYALAFAGPFAVGIVGMVAAGIWSDRSGPAAPVLTAVALFTAGLLLAGAAPGMPLFLLGRLVQGLGSGAVNVALYVVVARAFPACLHGRVFAAFATAWVVPSLVGPFLAGLVAELAHWRWVFFGIAVLALLSLALVAPALRRIPRSEATGARPRMTPLAWAAAAAAGVLAVNLAASFPDAALPLIGGGAVVAVVAAAHLLPRGSLRAARGLPAVIALRGVIAATYFGAEIYLPYMFVDEYDFSATFAGLSLTIGAIGWSLAANAQSRLGERLPRHSSLRLGTVLVLIASLGALATALWHLHPAVAIVGWALGGCGMGLISPRLSVTVIEFSTPAQQGFHSSALNISDALGTAGAIAVTGVIVGSLAPLGAMTSFAGVFVFTAVVAVVAMLCAPRVERT